MCEYADTPTHTHTSLTTIQTKFPCWNTVNTGDTLVSRWQSSKLALLREFTSSKVSSLFVTQPRGTYLQAWQSNFKWLEKVGEWGGVSLTHCTTATQWRWGNSIHRRFPLFFRATSNSDLASTVVCMLSYNGNKENKPLLHYSLNYT